MMNWFDRIVLDSNTLRLFKLYLDNVFGGSLSSVAADVVLILGVHAVTMFFLALLFVKAVNSTGFGKTFAGRFVIYLSVILAVLISHFVDIVYLSMSLDSLKVFPNSMSTFYYVVGLYTTVGSNYNPSPEWQGLAVIIPFCGLFAFSLSGSALFTMLGYFLSAPKPTDKQKSST